MVIAFGSGYGELARRLGHFRPFQPMPGSLTDATLGTPARTTMARRQTPQGVTINPENLTSKKLLSKFRCSRDAESQPSPAVRRGRTTPGSHLVRGAIRGYRSRVPMSATAGWCPAGQEVRVYLTRASFPRVRRQRVQISTRTGCPWSTTCLRWTLGRKSRFVRRFEKLTFLPNVLVLPQTSHWATGVPPCRTSAPDARSARLAEVQGTLSAYARIVLPCGARVTRVRNRERRPSGRR